MSVLEAPAFGRLLRAIRQDELAVAAVGKGVLRVKVEAAALAIPNALAAPLRHLIYGVLLIAFAAFRPQGLLGERL